MPSSRKDSILPAIFPFNHESGFGFGFVWAYQVIGASYIAIIYSTFDTLVTGVFFHATAQIDRLRCHLSKVFDLISGFQFKCFVKIVPLQIWYDDDQDIGEGGSKRRKTHGILIENPGPSVKKPKLQDKKDKIRAQLIDCIEYHGEILA